MYQLIAREMTAEDVDHIVANFRREDRAEIAAAGETPNSVRAQFMAAVADPEMVTRVFAPIEGPPVMGFGFHANGYVWMLGTTEIEKHAREIAKRSRHVFNVIMKRQERMGHEARLWTMAFRFNALHLKWLAWCGFVPYPNARAEPDQGPDFVFMRR